MELSVGDFIDRFSIIDLKRAHLGNEMDDEWQAYFKDFGILCSHYSELGLEDHFNALRGVNAEIWNYETDLRTGKLERFDTSQLAEFSQEKLLQLAAVGMSAINIRNANRRRKQLVNALVEETGVGFKDTKVEHASEKIEVTL